MFKYRAKYNTSDPKERPISNLRKDPNTTSFQQFLINYYWDATKLQREARMASSQGVNKKISSKIREKTIQKSTINSSQSYEDTLMNTTNFVGHLRVKPVAETKIKPIVVTTLDNAAASNCIDKKPIESQNEAQMKDSIPLSNDNKKEVIKVMLREKKIPDEIVNEHISKIPTDLNEDGKLDKLAEAILATYDVLVLDSLHRPGTCSKLFYGPHKRPTSQDLVRKRLNYKQVSKLGNEEDQDLVIDKRNLLPSLGGAPWNRKKNSACCGNSGISPSHHLKNSNCHGTASPHLAKIQRIKKLDPKPIVYKYKMNEVFQQINKYISMTAKNKDHRYDLKAINAFHKKLNLGKAIISCEELKSREKINQLKENLLRYLYTSINKANDIGKEYVNAHSGQTNTFFIGGGNNGPLVKAIMRERWWWNSVSDKKGVNLLWTQWRKLNFIQKLKSGIDKAELAGLSNCPTMQICNHLEGNYYLGHKKGLFKSLLRYYELQGKDVFSIIPLTFHIKKGKSDENYIKFHRLFQEYESEKNKVEANVNQDSEESDNEESTKIYNKNVWIIKPGENTNRGNGILVTTDIKEIEGYISDSSHTYIIQKYIEQPLLFEKRKFDIRCFSLVTSINGQIKAFYYNEGYLRTSSKEYSLSTLGKAVHLTNEAIQIKYDSFGKHEAGNKVPLRLNYFVVDFICGISSIFIKTRWKN